MSITNSSSEKNFRIADVILYVLQNKDQIGNKELNMN